MTDTSKTYYSWAEFDSDIEHLKNIICKQDLIVGIMRGGMIPAVALSHKLTLPCEALQWSTRDSKTKEQSNWVQKVVHAVTENLRILVVDDIADSGLTIHQLKAMADSFYERETWERHVEFATIHFNTAQEETVDYYARTIDRSVDSRWIQYPWE